ncbi:type II asparaginase [Cellulophaga baltica]|uniref:type II asparaginase n=1 Tax=Cellulophaga baltica TaxID=76594 RepID=UPI0024954B33|nr:type II asparaginase [Cellulophaga baltica]
MKKVKKMFALLLMAFISSNLFAQQLPRIKILATGGTIAGKGTSPNAAGYQAGVTPINDMIDAVPGIDKLATLTAEQVSNIGSQDMTVAIWLKLAKRIDEIFKNDEADGIVITHGTDTMEETAYFLSLTNRYSNPVILTGSMRAGTAMSSDGPKNLYNAVQVAADPLSKEKGVMVVFNGVILDAREAVKTNTTHVDAFTAPNTGPMGQVLGETVRYYTTELRAANKNTPFDVTKLDKLPDVAVVLLFADASDVAMNAYVKEEVDGIVTAGLGDGNLNKINTAAVMKATNKGVTVCRASRVPTGRVILNDETDDKKIGSIVGDDLNPQKARILLMLGLTQSKEKETLQNYFFKY